MLDHLRLLELEMASFGRGYHKHFSAKANAVEWVAYLANEPHNRAPESACPIIAGLLRKWNNDLRPDDRDRLLKPLVPRVVGTRSTDQVMTVRGWMVMDWVLHQFVADWLGAAGNSVDGDRVSELPRIADFTTAVHSLQPLREILHQMDRPANMLAGTSPYTGTYAAASRACRDSGNGIGEFVFEEVMLNYRTIGFFHPETYDPGTQWPPESWWPPFVRLASNIGWFAALTIVSRHKLDAQDPQSAAEVILRPASQTLQLTVVELIERMIELSDRVGRRPAARQFLSVRCTRKERRPANEERKEHEPAPARKSFPRIGLIIRSFGYNRI